MATLAELQEELTDLKAAKKAVLSGGQSYGVHGSRTVTRVPIEELNRDIKSVEMRIALASNKGGLSHSQAIFGGRE